MGPSKDGAGRRPNGDVRSYFVRRQRRVAAAKEKLPRQSCLLTGPTEELSPLDNQFKVENNNAEDAQSKFIEKISNANVQPNGIPSNRLGEIPTPPFDCTGSPPLFLYNFGLPCDDERKPLYAAPPRLDDLVVDYDDQSDGDVCPDMSRYLGLVRESPQEYFHKEVGKLAMLLLDFKVAWNIPENVPILALRLVRKLIISEARRQALDPDDSELWSINAQRWLSSTGFIRGLYAISKIIESRSLMTEEDEAIYWDVLMLIEPIVKAEPLISLDASISGILASQERALLYEKIWQGEMIYTFLRNDHVPRSRRSSLSSPGKALRALTHPVPAGVTPLEFFFRKFLRAAATVIEHLIVALQLSRRIRQASWTLFVGGIEAESHFRLLQGRNLLALVACTVYSVAKLFDEDRTFTRIISALSKHYPSAGERWFRNLPLDNGSQGDLVLFYNDLYLEFMRERIYSLISPKTPDKRGGERSFISTTPFPKVMGSVTLARNVTLEVSPGPLCTSTPTRTSTCIAILGSLGARRRLSEATLPAKVSRRLHF